MFAKLFSLLIPLFILLYIGALLAVYVLPHFDYAFVRVGTDNTVLGFKSGDSIFIKKTDLANIKEGDVVAFNYQNFEYAAFLEVKNTNTSAKKLTLYMDKEKDATTTVSYNAVQGVKIVRLPHLAGTLAFFQDFTGKMLAAIVTASIIIIQFGLGRKRKGGLEI